MSKSAFEKWYQREYVGDKPETFKGKIFHRHARRIALARLRWALRQKKSSVIYGARPNINPDKLRAEIKKLEKEK
jgi:hypothetical protein